MYQLTLLKRQRFHAERRTFHTDLSHKYFKHSSFSLKQIIPSFIRIPNQDCKIFGKPVPVCEGSSCKYKMVLHLSHGLTILCTQCKKKRGQGDNMRLFSYFSNQINFVHTSIRFCFLGHINISTHMHFT